jgi:hypothetical protein
MAHSVSLSWAADPDAVLGYHVYRGVAAGQETVLLTSTPIVATNFVDSSPNVGENFYVVKAVGAGNVEAPPSNEVSTVILPAAVTGLTITASS